MAENELLKSINRELKVVSLENSEKKQKERPDKEEEFDNEKDKLDNKNNNNESVDSEEEIEEIAKEQIDDIKDEIDTDVLSSDPALIDQNALPLERNEIDDADSIDGVLDDYKQDKTAAFIDPDSVDENAKELKVVDTTLGVFTVLNHDEKSVLLLDCNKQKIQISLDDFNNLHPFEIRDEKLVDLNDFNSAYKKDVKNQEAIQKQEKEQENNESETDENENEEDSFSEENPEEEEESSFGEALDRKKLSKENNIKLISKDIKKANKNKKENLISVIQKNLSNKKGVSETIRSDVRSKNRCILVANKAKTNTQKEQTKTIKENKPHLITKKKLMTVCENKKTKLKKETTQPSAIYTAPQPLSKPSQNFDVDKVMTIKDGKFVLVKLEGKNKIAYLKLKPKQKLLSINELKFKLNEVNSFLESLNCVLDNYYILEKEVIMKKFRKFEAEEVEDLEQELEDVSVEDEDEGFGVEEDEEDSDDDDSIDMDEDSDEYDSDDMDEDSDEDNSNDMDEDSEEQPDSIQFSTEINGVKYSGTLYKDESDDDEVEEDEVEPEDKDVEDDEDSDDKDEDEDEDSDVEDDDDVLILKDEDEIEELDIKADDKDESVIKAKAKIYGNRYNVSFCNVKKEAIKKAKLEMKKHNILEAWNALVLGARKIKC